MKEQKGSIPRSFIDDLLARSDIVQLINQRVPLKKAGVNYKACCPFHNEKTPSFNVVPHKQFYHCFGCGASGDALKFLMEYEGLSFIDAITQLAAYNGVEVPREKITQQQQAQQQQQIDLYDVTLMVAKYYRQQLKTHVNATSVKTYLKQRGLSAEIAKQFYIGYAPKDISLEQGLSANKQLKELLFDAGMFGKNDNGIFYNRFRDRVMFPIRDVRGRVVAFGGRVLCSEQQPKYLNSPETVIFHKSYTLYGLYEMRMAKDRSNHIIVVEGYMDVVALAQFGVKNAVATLGTAVTIEHLEVLFRQVDEIVFCFDGDNAGKKAAWKALELSLPLLTETRAVRFLFLDEGEDPDSTIRKEGNQGFSRRVKSSMSISEFLFTGLQAKIKSPISSIEGQQQLISIAKPYIVSAKEAMPDLLTKVLAQIVELPVWRLGQILQIRVASTKQIKAHSNKPLILKPTNIVVQLLAIIFKRPAWVGVFEDDFLANLKNSLSSEFNFLERCIQTLTENGFLIDNLIIWLTESNQQQIIKNIELILLKDDDKFLEAQFDGIIVQILNTLTEEENKKNIKLKIGI